MNTRPYFESTTEAAAGQQNAPQPEEQLHSLIENAPIGVYRTTPDGRILHANPALLRMLGYANFSELARRNLEDDFEPTYERSEFRRRLEAEGEIHGLETTWKRADGSTLFVREHARVVLDEAGRARFYEGTVEDITERKRAEQKMRERTLFLHALLDHNPLAIVVVDASHRVQMCNSAFSMLFGYRQSELLGAELDRLLAPPGLLAEAVKMSRQALSGERVISTTRRRHRDGSLVDVEVHAVDLTVDGTRIGGIGIYQDITQRRKSEQKLEESQRFLQHTLDALSTHVAIVDQKGEIVAVNAAWRKFGAENALREGSGEVGVNYLAVCEAVTGEDREQALAVAGGLRQVLAGRRESFGLEYPCHSPEQRRWFSLLITRFEHAGEARAVIAHQDITERVEAERSTRLQNAWLNALIENSPLAIAVHDPKGRVRMCNPAFQQLFRCTAEEAVGASLDELVATGRLNAEAQTLSQRVAAGERLHTTTRRTRRDGSLVDVEVHGVPLLVEGELVGGYAIYQDVTTRKELETQLSHMQKMEAVGRLAGGVAHDFNNLLMIISGYAELLADHPGLDEKQRNTANEIRGAAGRATSLTRQLLTFSRRQPLQPEPLDLSARLGELRPFLRRLIPENIEFFFQAGAGTSSIHADRAQLEQVVMNLIMNAVDAMPTGGRLQMETSVAQLDQSYAQTHPQARPGNYVCLTVADTGTGMGEETKARLFEPFFTTKPQGKGTGLGLATVYGFVRQSGGHITVDSEPGRGTTFCIYLPQTDQPAAQPESEAAPVARSRARETVLLVEDEEGVRGLVHEFLTRQGYTVLAATNGAEALEMATNHPGPIQLMLTDVIMPGMSGRELAERMSQVRPETKVLFASGYPGEAILQQGELRPGAVLLQKPFQLQVLAQKLREVLDSGV